MRTKSFFVTALVLVVGILAIRQWRLMTGKVTSTSTIARHAPAITLTDLSGNSFNTTSLKGKVVVVNFWAAWCGPCADEIPQFVELQKKYESKGLQVIGISMDDTESELREFCRRTGINYPVIAGSQATAEAYGGILGLPTTFVINRQGNIEKKIAGTTDFRGLQSDIEHLLDR